MLRILAGTLSVITHPLLVPTYMLFLLILINPYLFGVSSPTDPEAAQLLIEVFMYTFFIPAASFLVMYLLDFISDLQVSDPQERIGPYLITAIFYLWVYYNLSKNAQFPPAYVSFMLGAVIALFLSFFLNIFAKISAHATGMGGLVAMVIISTLWFSYGSFILPWNAAREISMMNLLMLVIIIAGAVGTARLLLKAHEPNDVYGGYLVGFAAQIFAFAYVF